MPKNTNLPENAIETLEEPKFEITRQEYSDLDEKYVLEQAIFYRDPTLGVWVGIERNGSLDGTEFDPWVVSFDLPNTGDIPPTEARKIGNAFSAAATKAGALNVITLLPPDWEQVPLGSLFAFAHEHDIAPSDLVAAAEAATA